jgi:uncharacterized protein
LRSRSASSSARRSRLGSALLLAGLACARAGAPPPAVTDAAGVLSAEQQQRIARHHDVLLRDHDVDYRVDVATGVGDLLAYGIRRFAELGVGTRSREGRGLLLVLDPAQDRIRLEVGQSLEGVFPDAFVAYLEERQMVPFFRAGRVADAILAATELVVTRAQQAEDRSAFQPPSRSGAAGGGAQARAAIGAGGDGGFRTGPDVAGAETPEQAVEAYLAAMRARNGSPDLELYTRDTRRMLREWVMTPAQMDAVAAAYRRCPAGAARIDEQGGRAVLRYPVTARPCAPWFLMREEGRWRLDLANAQRVLRFGAGNAWHFATGEEHPYAFAFSDWHLDRHGFPHAP